MLLIEEKNIVTFVDFDGGISFYPQNLTKIKQIKRERIHISRFCEKPKFSTSIDQHNCFFDEQHTSKIFLNLYN